MKAYKLKKDSWHYWLATFGDDSRVYRDEDICRYIRCVIVGSILALISLTVVGGISGAVLYTIGNLFGWLFLGYELAEVSRFVLSILAGLAVAAIGTWLYVHIKNKNENTEPGFVRLAYRRFKEKSCTRVEFE